MFCSVKKPRQAKNNNSNKKYRELEERNVISTNGTVEYCFIVETSTKFELLLQVLICSPVEMQK